MERIRRHRRGLAIAVGAIALLVWSIDDPLRDFTENHAAIAEGARDPRLRPREFDLPVPQLAGAIEQAARRIRGWEYVGDAESGSATVLLFVHTTRVWGFVDDVTLRLEDVDGRTVVTGESRSRSELGDLGRNPRNLRRILSELELVLARERG
jgi:hypothetical protein